MIYGRKIIIIENITTTVKIIGFVYYTPILNQFTLKMLNNFLYKKINSLKK